MPGPTAARGIHAISAYEGTWKTEIEHFATRFSKPGKESKTIRNDCWRSGSFFACAQFIDGESKALIVFTYQSTNDTYNSYPIPADGGQAGSGKLIVKGNVRTFPWEDTEQGKTIYFQVVNVFTALGEIEYRQEFSTDKMHWTVSARGRERNIK